MATLKLKRIKCFAQEDWTLDDDIEILVDNRAVWRRAMDTGQERSIGLDHEFAGQVTIKLLEKDVEGDDNLGTVAVSESHSSASEREGRFTQDDANYTLWYEVSAGAAEVEDGSDEQNQSEEEDPAVCSEEDEEPVCSDPNSNTAPEEPVEPCPMGAIGVVVKEPGGDPVPGATVTISDVNRTETTQDPNGNCQFEDVAEGSITVEARKENHTPDPASTTVQVVAGATASVELELDLATACVEAIPNLTRTSYRSGHAHFDVTVDNSVLQVTSNIEFVKGFAAKVVALGSSVPDDTGGLLDGQIAWRGKRWMKQVGTAWKYWDGTAWQNLPTGFTLADSNNFGVGFYKIAGTGGADDVFRCQYGGDWPETFTDWDINSTANQAELRRWESEIRTKWSGKFDVKRIGCTGNAAHCRYSTTARATFVERTTFARRMLIVADGSGRANDSLFFMDLNTGTAAHEFGHHLGNGDEYSGASSVDTSLNTDGAVNGIDSTSVMGRSKNLVKKRHFRTVCTHLATMVQAQASQSYTYEAVDRT